MASGDEQTGARFFKLILHSTVHDKRLLLPRKFIRNSAGGLLCFNSATLKLPSGDELCVEIVKEGGDVLFAGGWQSFAEFYSLQYGHFLVFEYFGGSSQFSVVICGRSATEIEYPVREVITIEDSAASVEVLEAVTGKMKRKKNSCLKEKFDNPIGMYVLCTIDSISRISQVLLLDLTSQPLFRREEKQQQQQQQAASSSTSKQQRPFFQVKLSRGHMVGGQLYMPLEFTRKHIKRTEESLKLEAGGKDRTVGLTRSKNKFMKLGIGWKSFIEENALKVGDVCNFELVGGGWTDVRLKVTIV